MRPKRLLVAVPFGALLFWLVCIEAAYLLTHSLATEEMAVALMVTGAIAAGGALIARGLARGRTWAWWTAISLGLLLVLPAGFARKLPEDVPLLGLGIALAALTVAGGFIAQRELLKPITRAPAPRDAAHHPAP